MSITEYKKAGREELTSSLASFIEAELTAAVKSRDSASLVVSGGSTPRPLFQALAGRELPWEKITITLADERWVDPSSKDSNEAMLRDTLLQGAASKARFIPLKNSADTALAGQDDCEQSLASIAMPFDLIILGMGNDGHTASLFPKVAGAALDKNTPRLCAPVQPVDAPHERLSLTARGLLNSRRIILHLVGDSKWQVYQQAIQPGAVDELPVRVVLHQDQVPVDVYWSA